MFQTPKEPGHWVCGGHQVDAWRGQGQCVLELLLCMYGVVSSICSRLLGDCSNIAHAALKSCFIIISKHLICKSSVQLEIQM